MHSVHPEYGPMVAIELYSRQDNLALQAKLIAALVVQYGDI